MDGVTRYPMGYKGIYIPKIITHCTSEGQDGRCDNQRG